MQALLRIEQCSIEYHSKLASEFAKLGMPKILCKHVSRIFTSFNIEQFNLSLSDKVSNCMISDINMFVPYFSDRVAGHENGALVS